MTTMYQMKIEAMPGDPYDANQDFHLKDGEAIILWSQWGVEGVFTFPHRMHERVTMLRRMAAYRTAMLCTERIVMNSLE